MDDNLNIGDAIDYGQHKGAGCLGDLVLATLRRLEHSGGPGAGDLVDWGLGGGQEVLLRTQHVLAAPLLSGEPAHVEMRKHACRITAIHPCQDCATCRRLPAHQVPRGHLRELHAAQQGGTQAVVAGAGSLTSTGGGSGDSANSDFNLFSFSQRVT